MLNYIILYYTILYYIKLYYIILYYIILYYIILNYIILYYIILNYIILYYIILNYMLYYIILYYITLYTNKCHQTNKCIYTYILHDLLTPLFHLFQNPSHAPFSTITPKGGGKGTKITAIFTASSHHNSYHFWGVWNY